MKLTIKPRAAGVEINGELVPWEQAPRLRRQLERAACRIGRYEGERFGRWLKAHDGKRQPPGGCPLSCSGRHR